MKALVQRVRHAKVMIDGQEFSAISRGILTFIGFERGDTEIALRKLLPKIIELRIFSDENGKMNRSLREIQGSHLIVSQFTLAGDCSSGRRPSFLNALPPAEAQALYTLALTLSAASGIPTQGGRFQADMCVQLENEGPATFLLEASDESPGKKE